MMRIIRYECSRCGKSFHDAEACDAHIAQYHKKRGGRVIPRDDTPDYSDAAYQAGSHVYGH